MFKISEIFASIQGEGLFTGLPVIFVRFHGCNLKCEFCDTKQDIYTEMDKNSLIQNILNIKSKKNFNTIVFTGGEPFLQFNDEFYLMINELSFIFDEIHFETNGTYISNMRKIAEIKNTQLIISPKIQDKKSDHKEFFKHLNLLESFKNYENVSFKFLINSKNELYYWVSFIRSIPELKQKLVYLQPEFNKRENLIKSILGYKFLQCCNYRISTQTHKFLNMR